MVLQYEYWPSLTWLQQLINANEWELEQWGSYQKQSLANRCKITGANGPVMLSVPLVAGREQKTLLKNVRIDNLQRWPIIHIRTIKSCYGKSPFFDHYFPAVENLLSRSCEWLIDLDNSTISLLLQFLKLNPEIRLTQYFQPPISPTTNQEYSINPYMQVFNSKTEFVPGLSVLDGLFCLGPQLNAYLIG